MGAPAYPIPQYRPTPGGRPGFQRPPALPTLPAAANDNIPRPANDNVRAPRGAFVPKPRFPGYGYLGIVAAASERLGQVAGVVDAVRESRYMSTGPGWTKTSCGPGLPDELYQNGYQCIVAVPHLGQVQPEGATGVGYLHRVQTNVGFNPYRYSNHYQFEGATVPGTPKPRWVGDVEPAIIVDPLAVPVRSPMIPVRPWPLSVPRTSPRVNPARSPVEQPQRGYDRPPELGRPLPRFVRGPRPRVYGRPGFKPPKGPQPPRPKEKEVKLKLKGWAAYAYSFYSFVTEFEDAVDSLYDAIPPWLKPKSEVGLGVKLEVIWNQWENIDFEAALNNLVVNEVTDAAIGGFLGGFSSSWDSGPLGGGPLRPQIPLGL